MTETKKPSAVFLDRDGTINVEQGYITTPAGLTLLPGSAAAIRRLNEEGIPVHVVTNQAGIARTLYTEEDLSKIHAHLRSLLLKEGAAVGSIYHCPHHPAGTVPEFSRVCDCRKPEPGMLRRAAKEHGIDLSRSVMIGDSDRDIQAGNAVGAHSILVQSGQQEECPEADRTVTDLAEAVRIILEESVSAPE